MKGNIDEMLVCPVMRAEAEALAVRPGQGNYIWWQCSVCSGWHIVRQDGIGRNRDEHNKEGLRLQFLNF